MSGTPPAPPPRVPPVLVPPVLAPPPAPRGAEPPAGRPASPARRVLIGLCVSVALAVLGIVPLLGLPGVLPLTVADLVIEAFRGRSVLGRFGDSTWGAALIVTLLAPVPIAPALAFFTWLRPGYRAIQVWLLAFAVAAAWALGVAFVVLLAH